MGKFKDEKEKINLTDPQARFMKDGRYRIDTNYNCQATLSKEQFILANEVITEPSDRKALSVMIEAADQNLGQSILEVAADAGYSSYDNYEYLDKKHKISYVPDQNFRKGNAQDKPYHQDHFTYTVPLPSKTVKEAHCWIEQTLKKFQYVIFSKKEKRFIGKYLMKITGYSKFQLTKHINQYRKTEQVTVKEYDRHKFQKKYTN